MRRLVSTLVLVGAVGAQVVLTAAPASAYEVRISITGAGQVTETTPANLVGSTCTTSANNPTGALGKTCLAGTPSGDYGWNWDVDYTATPKSGYRFVRWESDGTTRSGVICDRSSPAATGTTYTGTVCKFRTPSDLQVRAVFEDVTAPTMASLNGPNAPVNGATTFTFSASSDPTVTGFECRVANVHDWVACSSGRSENPAASGNYTFEVRAVDASGNKSPISTWEWTVDKTAPETSISLSPSGTVRSTSATFEFTSNESGAFQCSLDSSAFTACGSPKSYSSLGQGVHDFAVRAVDLAGNADPTPVSRTWTVDTVAPNTTITTKPQALTNNTTADFGYTSEPGATYTCTLDGSPNSCAGPHTVGTGEHTFTVAATDPAGNTDPTPASWTWTVDTVAPDTQLTGAPDVLTASGSASFAYSATGGHTGYVCTLDGTGVPCANPYVVDDGQHTFTVAARDAAGNIDPSPASHTWTVDTLAPNVTSKAPTGRKVSTRSNVVVVFSEAMREAVLEASRNGKPRAITLALGRTTVPARVTYAETAAGAFRAVLNPTRRLKAGKEYQAAVTARPLDLAGNAVTPSSWRFRTRR